MKILLFLAVVGYLLFTHFERISAWFDRAKAGPVLTATTHLIAKTIEEKLDLTTQQNHLFHLNRAQYRLNEAEIDAQIKIKKAELENEIDEDRPNMDMIKTLCDQLGVLYGKKFRNRISYQVKLENKILTPQQAAKLEDSLDQGKYQTVNMVLSH